MPDDTTRSAEIERAINRDVAGALTLHQHAAGTFSVVPRSMAEVFEMAKMMAVSGICVRPIFRGNPGSCLAIIMQAMKWGADPFAVANKAFEVNGQLAYESQLIHAIVNSSPALAKRLNVTFSGEGQQRKCIVTGLIKGEDEMREYESPRLSEIKPQNSPLWKVDPDQQLFYYSTRAWARRWVPEILLGIYAPDEMQARTIEMEPEPEPRREDFPPIAEPDPESVPSFPVVDLDGVVREFRTVEAAEQALTLVLTEAAKRGPDALDGAGESNPIADWPDMPFRRIAHLIGELRDRPSQAPPASEAPPAPQGSARPEPAATASPSYPVAATAADWQEEMEHADRNAASPPPRRSVPRRAPPADLLGDAAQPPTNLLNNPSTAASPPTDGTRQSMRIMPVRDRQKDEWDWRVWTRALFAQRIKQQLTVDDIAQFCSDNAENIEAAEAAGFGAEIEAAIAAQYAAVPA